MTKHVSYYIQDPQVDRLTSSHGEHLERLTPDQKRKLISLIANPQQLIGDRQVDEAYQLVKNCSQKALDHLLHGISAQLLG